MTRAATGEAGLISEMAANLQPNTTMNGYDANFLGINLPLPSFTAARAGDILGATPKLADGIAPYPNYSAVTDKRFRQPAFTALHIEQGKLKPSVRKKHWKVDSRIGSEWQLDDSYYHGEDNLWDKGHMADRESAAWGETPAVIQERADQTFYYANACLQHKFLNEDEWRSLEVWVMDLEKVKGGRLTVFTGPVFGEHPRTSTPEGRPAATVPAGFFKVACFINLTTNKLDVRAFIIYQDADAIRGMEGRRAFNYTKYQVTITEIERRTELRFPDLVRATNPLYFHENAAARSDRNVRSFPERIDINRPDDIIRAYEDDRVPVADDEVEVYIATAHVSPDGGAAHEAVSLANFEGSAINLTGWTLVDAAKRERKLSGSIPPGGTVVLRGTKLKPVRLSDTGGVLTLFNAQKHRIDCVDYTEKEVVANRQAARSAKKKTPPLNFLTYRQGLNPR